MLGDICCTFPMSAVMQEMYVFICLLAANNACFCMSASSNPSVGRPYSLLSLLTSDTFAKSGNRCNRRVKVQKFRNSALCVPSCHCLLRMGRLFWCSGPIHCTYARASAYAKPPGPLLSGARQHPRVDDGRRPVLSREQAGNSLI